jgi:hypothetical protein
VKHAWYQTRVFLPTMMDFDVDIFCHYFCGRISLNLNSEKASILKSQASKKFHMKTKQAKGSDLHFNHCLCNNPLSWANNNNYLIIDTHVSPRAFRRSMWVQKLNKQRENLYFLSYHYWLSSYLFQSDCRYKLKINVTIDDKVRIAVLPWRQWCNVSSRWVPVILNKIT